MYKLQEKSDRVCLFLLICQISGLDIGVSQHSTNVKYLGQKLRLVLNICWYTQPIGIGYDIIFFPNSETPL